jgi:hypothetical protein
MKYRIEINGRGGEVVLGTVKREFYDFVEENDISFEDYAGDWGFFEENDIEILEDIRPFEPGDWYDCDDLAHSCGSEVDYCYITVMDDDGTVIYDDLTFGAFAELGMDQEVGEEVYPTESLSDGDVYYLGQSFEKGLFQAYEVEAETFDPAKLTLIVSDYDGWELVTGAKYDGVDLDDLGELSTTGKGSDYGLVLVEKD